MTAPASSPAGLASWVKPAVLEFKEAELLHLRRMPDSALMRLCSCSLEEVPQRRHGIRHYGDVAFCLAGVKPCALIAHGGDPAFAGRLVEACLRPLLDKYCLEAKGFQLHEIRHPHRTSNPVHPGFQWGWVLANACHHNFPLVRRAFLQPARGPVSSPVVQESLIGQALGYPPAGDAVITYRDMTECAELGVDSIIVAEYCCCPGDEMSVTQHFDVYCKAWQQLGRRLHLDTSSHPQLEAVFARVQRRNAARSLPWL
ncbi:hypothetical protein D9Q98_004917 [Chlorella vulgaris]|uniref:Uncharacterized protein n=1 Tax=Chlorella vulgaris TaxID=3077 RepID=A0A9D4TNA0_CHLVU|nr:hypothetical protein D9Q98_004917 [Chlorella vulgaris]